MYEWKYSDEYGWFIDMKEYGILRVMESDETYIAKWFDLCNPINSDNKFKVLKANNIDDAKQEAALWVRKIATKCYQSYEALLNGFMKK